MKGELDRDRLAQLLGQIERAWLDHQDRTLIYRLTEQHPEFRDELSEFFENMILGPIHSVSKEIEDSEERVYQWLQSSGFEMAKASALRAWHAQPTGEESTSSPATPREITTPSQKKDAPDNSAKTWLGFLKQRCGQRLPELARALPNVTTEYLVLVSRHPNLLPEPIKRAFAEFAENCWRIPQKESFEYLSLEPRVLRAALRLQSFDVEPSNFQELLERSSLSKEQKEFWMTLTKE